MIVFGDRLIFPIRDPMGRTIAFGGRILPQFQTDDRTAKYVNSPENPLYSKSRQLYGLDVARDVIRKRECAVVMEGYTDVVMARQFGIDNGVAVLGTALTPQHLSLLRRFCQQVVLLLDGDDAGQRRANEVLELFVAQQMDLRVVTLPDRLDPCDYALQYGADALCQQIEQATDALQYKLDRLTESIDIQRDTHRSHQALEEILRVMSTAPRQLADRAANSQLREQQVLVRLAREFQLSESDLRQRLSELRRHAGRPTRAQTQEFVDDRATRRPIDSLAACDRELLELLTQLPEALDEIAASVSVVDLSSELGQTLYQRYLDFAETGRIPHFADLLTSIESVEMQNVLVELDELASEKWDVASTADETREAVSPMVRVAAVIAAFERRQSDQRRRAAERALEVEQLDDSEQVRLLRELWTQQKNRQGISAPTDG